MNLKAYAWDDEDYGESYLVWATTPGKAKALLAAEHDREFTEIRVYRVPWADKYGEKKIIPAKELLSHGWWLYCSNCIQPKPREIDRIHQQILCAPRLADHKHSKR